MNQRLFVLLLLLLLAKAPLSVFSQNLEFTRSNFPGKKEELKEAIKNLDKGDDNYKLGKAGYAAALPFYLKAYQFNSRNADLNFKIGICYINSLKKPLSAPFLESAYRLDPNVDSQILYWLGRAYHLNMLWDEAIEAYTKFRDLLPASELENQMPDLNKKIEECKNGRYLIEHPVRCFIDNLGPNINSQFSEHSPVIKADESVLVYTSRRDVTTGGGRDPDDGDYYEDIMIAYKEDKLWGPGMNIGTEINTNEHDAAIGLSPDGNNLFIYKGDNGGDIYLCKLKGEDWSAPDKMPKIINTQYHESTASYTYDYRYIYFTSDRPDLTLGGRDVMMARINKKGEIEEPVNVGPVINTKYDEEGVFMHPDGKTMYFSSKGHKTMGGYDIFKSVYIDSLKTWSEPENIGHPINTPDDDVYFVVSASGVHGYFSSFKKDGFGEKDIYKVTFLGPEKEMQLSTEDILLASVAAPVIEKQVAPGIATAQLTILKGRTLDAKTLQPVEAGIDIIDNNANEVIATILSNAKTGKYLLTLPSGKNYGISVSAAGYLFHSENFDIPASQDYQEITKDFYLKGLEVGQSIVLKNIFFDFDKATLRKESTNELERLIKLLNDNPTIRIELGSHTDNFGPDDYNQRLSQSRSKSVVDYLIAHGIPKTRLEYKGYGETMPSVPNTFPDGRDNPANRQLNRRTEFKIISK